MNADEAARSYRERLAAGVPPHTTQAQHEAQTPVDRVRATWRTVEVTDDDMMTMLSVHLTPRVVAVIASAMKDENGEVPSWHVAVIEGGETTGNMLVNDADLVRALREVAR